MNDETAAPETAEAAPNPLKALQSIAALGENVFGVNPVQIVLIYPEAAHLSVAMGDEPLYNRIAALEDLLRDLREEQAAEDGEE
ncbi:hypothetical protein SEA_KEALII_52 [Arthrobacter phage KeAlii]|uniref:Uncharacterized protein n=1 Tax=Arthrobacter phage KeAlii TaxID=2885973 RepID=A0AA95B889_9CAUD|nr:hypothetical protein PQE15_gp52 [Arthrobacter phage KeAlii]UDL14658.1 hypothetical protein SEA_KEALII_52 [Arthrobacter phage KeAlii]